MEVFSELYGTYYNTVAKVVEACLDHPLTERELTGIIRENAFEESVLQMLPSIRKGEWKLFTHDGGLYRTVLRHKPEMPLTSLQKRWLKTVFADPRARLFCEEPSWLEGIKPLYLPEDVYCFDCYADGDAYTDEGYIGRFRQILRALREKRKLHIVYISGVGKRHDTRFVPHKLEYSMKDDKFRLLALREKEEKQQDYTIINLSRMIMAEALECHKQVIPPVPEELKSKIVLEITDERNALERVMLHFANYAKTTQRTGKSTYRMTLSFNEADETEILIRVLSFGQFVKVTSPPEFIAQIRARLKRQKLLNG